MIVGLFFAFINAGSFSEISRLTFNAALGKIGLNAWLATRKEKREKEKPTEE